MVTVAAGFAPAPLRQIRDRKMGSLHVLTKNRRGANRTLIGRFGLGCDVARLFTDSGAREEILR
jgi:hypothetical protein